MGTLEGDDEIDEVLFARGRVKGRNDDDRVKLAKEFAWTLLRALNDADDDPASLAWAISGVEAAKRTLLDCGDPHSVALARVTAEVLDWAIEQSDEPAAGRVRLLLARADAGFLRLPLVVVRRSLPRWRQAATRRQGRLDLPTRADVVHAVLVAAGVTDANLETTRRALRASRADRTRKRLLRK